MAQKKFKKYFSSGYRGINGLSSAIEETPGTVARAVNYETAVSNSLRGVAGCQNAGGRSFFGLFPYTYSRTQDQYTIKYQTLAGTYPTQTANLGSTKTTADGATINKLIGINQQMWVRDTYNFPLTYVSGSNFTWYAYVNGSNINFLVKNGSTTILDTSLGDGVTTRTTIYSLMTTLSGLAQFLDATFVGTRGSCPPFAIVNGNQTAAFVAAVNYGVAYQITVANTPHTFRTGDVICFPDGVMNATDLAGVTTMSAGVVLAQTPTTITYAGPQVRLTNGQVLGYMGQPAAQFPITVAQTTTGAVAPTINMPYWRWIPEDNFILGHVFDLSLKTFLGRSAVSGYRPPTYTNSLGNLFVTTSSPPAVDNSYSWNQTLVKTDGAAVFSAGMMNNSGLQSTNVVAGALTGTFKYKMFFRRTDAQGNIVDGAPCTPISVKLTAEKHTISFVTPPSWGITGGAYQSRNCRKLNNETPAAGEFFYIQDDGAGNAPFIQPGDPICFVSTESNITGLSAGTKLYRTVCTDYCQQIATISPTGQSIRCANTFGKTIPANSIISAGLTAVFLRTTDGGNTYYNLCEMPVSGYSSVNVSFEDNVADADLVGQAQYIESVIGKERNPPPACSIVTQHQGGLVVAGGFNTPNTVSFSSADGIEYFPTASNSFDVPSTQSGPITAIASDTNDRLGVFKERAYYDVIGDLDGGNFSINVRNEGDYGVSSQASLLRVKDVLVGVCPNGFVRIADGILDPFYYANLNARLINQNYNFNWARAVNDAYFMRYICSIPTTTVGAPETYVLDYSVPNVVTFELSFPSQVDSAGGAVSLGSDLYHLSEVSPYGVFRRLERFNGNSPTGNDGDTFIHNTSAITNILETNPIADEDPGTLSTPIRIRIWSIPNDFVQDGWVPFSVTFDGGSSPLAAYLGSGFNGGTTAVVSFAAASDMYKDIKLVQTVKTLFYTMRFTTNTIRQSPFITGYEILYAENYIPEDFGK